MATNTLSNLQNQAKQSISEAAKPTISFAPSALEQTQKMAQAATGKAESGMPGAAVSNIAEQVAVDQTAQQQAEVQQQANLAERAQQVEEEQQYLQLQDQEIDYRMKGQQVKQEFNSQLSKLLQDFKEKGDDLNLEKSRAAAEQIGALMRLQDDKYVNGLKLEGARRRLDSNAKFKEAAMEAAFENQLGLLNDDFNFKSMMRADDRQFKIQMEQLGLQQALDVVQSEIDGQKDALMWRGVGGLAEAGITAWGTGMFDSKATPQKSMATSEVNTATDLRGNRTESAGQQSLDDDGGIW